MDFTVKENIPGLMLSIDFQKAFDSVEWEFLFKCLEAFNIGPDFLNWVKIFYKNIQSCILNNGMTSRSSAGRPAISISVRSSCRDTGYRH